MAKNITIFTFYSFFPFIGKKRKYNCGRGFCGGFFGGKGMHYLDYNEKIEHGTPDFPIAFYHVDEHHSRYNMPFHWHKEMELIQVQSGSLRLFLDDREILARASDVILIEEGVIHGGIPEHCVYECAVFDLKSTLMHTDACKRYIRLISRHQIQLYNYFQAVPREETVRDPSVLPGAAPSSMDNSRLLQAVGRLFDAIRYPHAGSELSTLGALYEIFGCLFEEEYYTPVTDAPAPGQKKMDQLKPVLEYIDANYSSPVTLADLSRIAGMTPKYFCRYFRAAIHRTPMDYLNYYRIERACYILSTTELPITDVAYQCGFNDSSYFVKTFKKYMDVTPKQYALRL